MRTKNMKHIVKEKNEKNKKSLKDTGTIKNNNMEKNTAQQNQIIRQSQVKLVVDYFTLIEKKPNLSDVIKISSMMEKYIQNGYTKELGESFLRIDEHIKTI